MTKLLWYIYLPFYAAWLLLICCFEDTSQWADEKLILLKRSFAAVMIAMMCVSLFFCGKALSFQGDYQERRVDRLEARLDYQVDKAAVEHREIFRRLEQLEASTQYMNRIVYGMIGLTIATMGQWALQLFKLKIERAR